MKKIILLSLITLGLLKSFAQNVGIGTATPNASAQLDVSSTTKGMLVPRMTDAEKNAITSPPQGLMIFNITTNSFQFYNGVAWLNISHSGIITGTANKVAKFTGPWGLASGMLTDNGTGVSLNNAATVANGSALLDISSNSKGILIPRMTTAERTAIVTPATGLLVFDNTTVGFWFYNGSAWAGLNSGNGGSNWNVNGNDISNNNTGNVGIATSSPVSVLHVKSNASPALTIENANPLTAGSNNAMYFTNDLTGASFYKYTGAIKSIGTNATAARLGFFTFASSTQSGLLEHMTITDGGAVGINNTNPISALDVTGTLHTTGAASIDGNLTVGGNIIGNNDVTGTLTVNNGKGVAYNPASGTNLKIFPFTTATFGAILPGFGLSAEGSIVFGGGFTNPPKVLVGDIVTTGGTVGELFRVQLILYGCTNNSCKARLLNTSPNAVNYNITWSCVAIGD
jgi:hypothetical protein